MLIEMRLNYQLSFSWSASKANSCSVLSWCRFCGGSFLGQLVKRITCSSYSGVVFSEFLISTVRWRFMKREKSEAVPKKRLNHDPNFYSFFCVLLTEIYYGVFMCLSVVIRERRRLCV